MDADEPIYVILSFIYLFLHFEQWEVSSNVYGLTKISINKLEIKSRKKNKKTTLNLISPPSSRCMKDIVTSVILYKEGIAH